MFERGGRGSTPPEVAQPTSRVAFALQLVQQTIDLFLLLHRRELRVHVIAHQLRVCLRGGFVMTHLALHAVEGRRIGVVPHGVTRVRGLAEGAGAAMLGDQHVALRFRLRHLLLQAEERRLQVVHLRPLILHLLPETGGGGFVTHAALHSGARQGVVLLVDGQSRAMHPLPLVLLPFLQFLLQDVLVGDRNRHLRFDLQQLILHIENHLLDHFFRVFRLIHKIVQIGPYQCCYPFQKCHCLTPCSLLHSPPGRLKPAPPTSPCHPIWVLCR